MDGNSIKIEGFEIISKIGQGGTSEVFLALQKSLNRNVILKRILKEDKSIDRLKKEAHILAQLNHKNIVTVYDFIESGGNRYIVEEYVQGASLDELIKEYISNNKHFNQNEFSNIALQIIEGVKKAHKSGIIHRDLKPGNILIDNNNNVKICDFGISSIEGNISTKTLNYLMGTIEYMPPELFGEKPEITKLGDVYSLGCIFYEMINLIKPFSISPETNILSVISKKSTSVPDSNLNAPKWFKPFADVFTTMLSIDPQNREGVIDNVYNLLIEIKNKSNKSINEEYCSSATDTIIKAKYKQYIKPDAGSVNKEIISKKENDNSKRSNNMNTKVNKVTSVLTLLISTVPITYGLQMLILIVYNNFNPHFAEGTLVFYLGIVTSIICMSIFLISVFISMINGLIQIQKKEKHGFFLLLIPVVITFLIFSLNSYDNFYISIIISILGYIFYFYLCYYFSTLIDKFKKYLSNFIKISIASLLMVFLIIGINYLYKYMLTRLTYKNIEGTWTFYTSNGGFYNGIVVIYYENGNLIFKGDENKDNIFQEDEIVERTYKIIEGNKIEVYLEETLKSSYYAELYFPDGYNGKAMIQRYINDDGTTDEYEFRQ